MHIYINISSRLRRKDNKRQNYLKAVDDNDDDDDDDEADVLGAAASNLF
jgi:hypothetical protein